MNNTHVLLVFLPSMNRFLSVALDITVLLVSYYMCFSQPAGAQRSAPAARSLCVQLPKTASPPDWRFEIVHGAASEWMPPLSAGGCSHHRRTTLQQWMRRQVKSWGFICCQSSLPSRYRYVVLQFQYSKVRFSYKRASWRFIPFVIFII